MKIKIKRPFQFLYGLLMATSVEFLKERKAFPIEFKRMDDQFILMEGGHRNCGIFPRDGHIDLIDTNKDQASRELKSYLDKNFPGLKVKNIYLTSESPEAAGGLPLYPGGLLNSADDSGFHMEKCEDVFDKPVQTVMAKDYLFTGFLFYNKIHPDFHNHKVKDLEAWIANLEELATLGRNFVPCEGSAGTVDDVLAFKNYLVDMSDPKVEYSTLRAKYGHYKEIIGLSSLADNMDYLRTLSN
jgi:hypothetical protein